MIYTSYFANLKNIPKEIIPISICGKTPSWYNGLEYKKIAPKYDFFMEWKMIHDNDYYIKCYQEQVLDKLNTKNVMNELWEIMHDNGFDDESICLICYEKPTDFCHRHLVKDWLNKEGYYCKEFIKEEYKL